MTSPSNVAKWSISGRWLFGAVCIAAALPVGCVGQVDGGDPGAASCVSMRERYTNEVYGKVLQSNCVGCHTPGGQSSVIGAKFQLVRETYPDFVTANLDHLRDYSKLEVEGQPVLLQKALGQRSHGGGAILKEDSNEYKILSSFVADLRAGNEQSCPDGSGLNVDLMSFKETYRKAAILLAGRIPTDEEFAAVSSSDALNAAIVKLTNEEPFYELLREAWNDELLTERGVDVGAAIGPYGHAPDLYDTANPDYTNDKRSWANASVSQEPMRLIEYVVRNNKPFSEILTANYIVANPYLARAYGLQHDKAMTPENYGEWMAVAGVPSQLVRVNNVPNGDKVDLPVAGVLTQPAFLFRWETTRTNKSRKRARVVLKSFLATDIFKFATRPIDSGSLSAVQNQTRNSNDCNVCHSVLDPIAGGFRGFDESNLVLFRKNDAWHDDLYAPGFGSTQMPPTSYGAAAPWLAAQIPNDSRFGLAVAQVMYRSLVGDEVLSFPSDNKAADYADSARAFNAQNDWFVKIGADFKKNKYDLRQLVVAIVRSPYFSAKSGDASKDALHAGLGGGRLLTPEMLARKYRATLGMDFFDGGPFQAYNARNVQFGMVRSATDTRGNVLVGDTSWRALLGGIDSGDTTHRAESVSPTMHAANEYMAGLLACRVATFEFTKPPAQRRLLAAVEQDTTPFAIRTSDTEASTAIAANEAKIREAIRALHWRLLGEDLAADSEEVSRTYGFFVDVWKDLEKADVTKAAGAAGKALANGRCQANVDYDKAPVKNASGNYEYPKLNPRTEPYAYGMVLTRDDNYTIRAWQAVLTYLLSDYRFNHE